MGRTLAFAALLGYVLHDVQSFAIRGGYRRLPQRYTQQSRRMASSHRVEQTRLQMTVEPVITLLLAADGASSLR